MNDVLYFTGVAEDGRPLIGGIFQMQDRLGFPIDACAEEAKRHGCSVDWLEAFCDCWLNDCLKFDSFVKQATLLTGHESMMMMFEMCGRR